MVNSRLCRGTHRGLTVTTVTKYFPPPERGRVREGVPCRGPATKPVLAPPIPTFPLEGGRRKKFAAVRRLTVLSGAVDDCMDAGGTSPGMGEVDRAGSWRSRAMQGEIAEGWGEGVRCVQYAPE